MSDDEIRVIKTSRKPGEFRQRLQSWLAQRTNDPNATIGPVSSPEANGMSSESLFFDATWNDRTSSFVARLAPSVEDVPTFMSYNLERQFEIIRLIGERSEVPVPELAWLESERSHLDVPFFVMHKADGRVPPDLPPYATGGWVVDLGVAGRAALQEASLGVLAGVHGIDISDGSADFLEFDLPGDTPMRRHLADQRAYYEWMAADAGRRFPTIERAFEWLEANWGAEQPAAISWGDSRIGNIMYANDGTNPVAVLDWEMAAIAPPALDVAWMCFMHRFFEYLLGLGGVAALPDLFRPDDVREQYGELTGTDVGDMRFEIAYNAVRHAIIMSRLHARNVHFGTHAWPADPDDAFLFKGLLAELTAD